MAGEFERMVRPYQMQGSDASYVSIPVGLSQGNSPVRLRFGVKGKVKVMNQSWSCQGSMYVVSKPKEQAQ